MSSARVVADEDRSPLVDLAGFDDLDRDAATRLLQPCCPSRRWASEVVSGRPYASMRELLTASDDVLADLSWPDVTAALHTIGRTVDDRDQARAELCRAVRLRLVTTLR